MKNDSNKNLHFCLDNKHNEHKHLILADASLADSDILFRSLAVGSMLRLVTGNCNVREILSNALQQSYQHLHFVGHGESGAITLGGTTLHARDFIALADTNNNAKSLHFWSCKTGEGSKGAMFVHSVAKALQCVVSACSGLVGAVHQGGSWVADVASHRSAVIPCPLTNAAAYPHTLATSLLRLNSVATATGVTVQVWVAANTAFSAATVKLQYNPTLITPQLANGKIVTSTSLNSWTWLSSQPSSSSIKIGGYSLQGSNNSSEILLQSVSFLFSDGVKDFSVTISGTFLENSSGTVPIGTLPTLTYVAPVLPPVWDAFSPPDSLSFTAGTTAAFDVTAKATDANGDTITYKAIVGQMVESAFVPTATVSTIALTSQNGHLTGNVELPRTLSEGSYTLRLYADDNTTDSNLGTILDVPFSLLAASNASLTGTVTISGTATQGQTLTASNDLADADGLGTIAYQWQADSVAISGATESSFMLTEAQVGKQITVIASYTDGYGTPESVVSDPTLAVANVNDTPTGTVSISGTATQRQTLTASNTLADADGLGAIAYHWQADGSAILGAIGSSFTLTEAHVGKQITVIATYTDGHSSPESVTSAATATVVNVNDTPTGTVSISGTATQGQTLTASNTLADADGLGTIAYQWNANGTTINGATGTSFTLTEAQVGKLITVIATYTDGHSTPESVTSAATAAVANVNDAPAGTVSISGTATQGQQLTASNSLADIDGLGTIAYQWNANGTTINVATGTSFTLTEAQVGKLITVIATYTDGHSTPENVTSAATAAVTNINDAPTGTVSISGTPTQGQTLTASNTLADADGLDTIAYHWQADGSAISGANSNSFTLTEAHVGKLITVTASYTDGHSTPESVTSAATAAVANINDSPIGTVSISGTPTQGQTLSASNALADADGLGTIAYHWQADGISISGATESSFTLTEAQVGKSITVIATYTDGHSTPESITSAATDVVSSSDSTPPTLVSSTPANDATGIAIESNIVLAFSEIIQKGSGAIELHLDSPTGTVVERYDVAASPNLTLDGNTLTINPTLDLEYGKHYVLTIAENALQDTAGNNVSNSTSYNFRTEALYNLQGTITFWGNDETLDGVTSTLISTDAENAAQQVSTTDTNGYYQHLAVAEGDYLLETAKEKDASMVSALTVDDAFAALKMAVKLNPNKDGSAVSNAQYLAADVNHDGKVNARDALLILKMSMQQQTAPATEWLFVPESIKSESMNSRAITWPENPQPVVLDSDQHINLIGIVSGDVDGSWVG